MAKELTHYRATFDPKDLAGLPASRTGLFRDEKKARRAMRDVLEQAIKVEAVPVRRKVRSEYEEVKGGE